MKYYALDFETYYWKDLSLRIMLEFILHLDGQLEGDLK